jgi:hypothetical protein
MSSVPFKWSVVLLLCPLLAACAAGGFPGGSFPIAGPAPEPPAPAAASAPSTGHARGGAVTAAAQAAADPDAPSPTDDPVIQARADCWMKVETQRALKGIDQRIAYVDKCVANELRYGPKP